LGGLDREKHAYLEPGRESLHSHGAPISPCALKSLVQAAEERMLKGVRGLRAETKPANRIVAKSSERSDPPFDVDPIEELCPHRRRSS
jgi:hypothetical protein